MNAIAATSLAATSLTAGSATGMPAVNPASEPEEVRRGGAAAKGAYQQGLEFGQVLLSELTQQLTATATDGDPDDGSSDSDGLGGSDGSGSSDPAAGAYSSLMTSGLSQSIMSGGAGTALALQIAQGIDPRMMSEGSR